MVYYAVDTYYTEEILDYALIPGGRMGAFKKFAARFGFTEERIKSVLDNEKR